MVESKLTKNFNGSQQLPSQTKEAISYFASPSRALCTYVLQEHCQLGL